ncbi:MAG: hypothetical protein A3J27_07295 [Candidatus Tectomicrobia bacterium RIFCSPLOWO2_12_FULL_69_37]|nr:MAG: hypothetical protein A3I72_15445 [Candidatus Tectomicrobia bacterium RIFCSPLOWO2_02_FULL_70_19]OGL62063.1 MAG: hypothetical protein A3J27_07295 [Candidatus Tectomicrobia bacterium RIFCSPLOWO2_12_FULL_69_37]
MGMLDGKRAIVTGASRGIGRAIALRLAQEGAAVFLAADGTEEELRDAAAECGAKAAWGVFDLERREGPEAMAAAALKALGGVDILVNNAGVRAPLRFGEFRHEDFDRLVAVNLRAPFFASQAVLPAMREAGGGRIIHIASQLGLVAAPRSALYSMTKAALIQLARSMALELAPEGITVNCVSPGPTGTAYYLERMSRNPEERAQRLGDIPAGRFAEPGEVASAVAFLASAEAAFVQGHNLVVDGGYVAH